MSYRKGKSKSFWPLSLIIAVLFSLTLLSGCSSVPEQIPEANVGVEQTEVVNEPSKTPSGEALNPNEEEPSVEIETPPVATKTPVVEGRVLVEFIDVGQGDSILVITPDNRTMLIDAGDRGNFGVISERLKKHNVSKIDVLVATHPHADHIGSMEEIIKGYDIGEIYMPDVVHTTQTFENLLLAIQGKGLGISVGKAGKSIPFGSQVTMDILAPVGSPSDLNNHSIVLYLTYGENTFLFTGDMESGMESRITGHIDADVLKVGHHGSSTSTSQDFLSRVAPEHSVISVGEGNRYNHPNAETVERLQKAGSKVYRTDKAGHITMISDGITIKVSASPSETVAASPPIIKPVENQPEKPAVESPDEDRIVFATKTGSKYHLDGCSSLSKSKIETTIKEAKGKGLEPCGVCHPGE